MSARKSPRSSVVEADRGRDDNALGTRLAGLRRQHGLSIRKLATDAGVSASLISEAERGLVEPSVGVLKRLAAALDVDLTYFFSRPGVSGETVIREEERRKLKELKGVAFDLLAPDHVRTLEPIFGRLQPGASTDELSHVGEEWGMVLRGRLKVWVGSEVYFLDPGDSIYFASTIPHRVANPSDEITEYVWVNVPRSL
jgi:transcriptional regulator with XRE-family HTH domain